MAKINLCSIPHLDNSYSNVVDFESLENREKYFTAKTYKTVEANFKYDNQRTSIVIKEQFAFAHMYDYIWYKENGLSFYYFITAHEFVTTETTKLHLELDVFTTYMFSYTFMPTFVDRMHVDRWAGDLPTYNIEEEEIGIGEYVLKSKEKICDLGDGVIITTSSPAGYVPSLSINNDNGVGSGWGGGGSILNNTMSQKGFIFIKQVEGFAPTPIYLEGLYSMGYGIVEKYQNARYRKLYPSCTEKEASEVIDDMMRNEFCKDVTNLLQDMGINLSSFPINQYDVWCSIAMNYGSAGLQRTSAWKYFETNQSDIKGIADKIRNLSSYPSRRKLEGDIYEFAKYPTLEEKPIPKYNGNSVSGTVEGSGYIPSHYQTSGSGSSTLQQKIVNSARKLIGKPYRYGGNYPPLGNSDGTDCSGLCEWAYGDNGKGDLIPHRWTTAVIKNYGRAVSQSEIQLADMILTPGHVVMYAGMKNGKHYIVEAPRTGLNIREREYTFPTNIISIRRIL